MTRFQHLHTRDSGVVVQADAVDIIGDIHGCGYELRSLLAKLGYKNKNRTYRHPKGRVVVFVGDLINRGPDTPGVFKIINRMLKKGTAMTVMGNHDHEFLRELREGDTSSRTRKTLKELDETPNPEKALRRAKKVLEQAHLWIKVVSSKPNQGSFVAVHDAWHPDFEFAPTRVIKKKCLYGPMTTLPKAKRRIRIDWRHKHPSDGPLVVHGHTAYSGPVKNVENTVCVDTACVFGGHLSAYRWPEGEVVQVPAESEWVRHADLRDAPPLTKLTAEQEERHLDWPWD